MSAPGLENGLNILEYILNNREAGFNQLKKDLNLSPASLNRYLKVLMDQNFLSKLDNGQYSLGVKMQTFISDSEIHKIDKYIYPLLKKISSTFKFTTLWISYEHGKMICKEKVLYPNGIVMQNSNEIRTDFIMNPWGLIFLAHCSEKDKEFYINQSYSKDLHHIQIPTKEEIDCFINEFNEKGYISDNGTIFKHLIRAAVPVYNKNKKLIASVVIGDIDTSTTQEKINESMPFIIKEVHELTKTVLG